MKKTILKEIEKTDIVHINFWNNPEIYQLLRSDLPEMRLLIWFHIAGDKAPQIITNKVIDFTDFALACSPYTYKHPAIQNLPPNIRTEKSGMVYGATDFERLSNITLKPHMNFNVGYIGTINFVKMHPNYIAMNAAINIPDVKFIVCGGGIENILKQQAKQLGKANNFKFLGYIHDIKSVIETLDVFGYPLCENTYAASELTLQEVMFAGVPPVVFPYGGVKHLIINGETGLIVNSEREYKEAIEFLYYNPKKRREIGQKAKEYAKEVFGAENAAKKLNPIYEKMMKKPKKLHIWGIKSDLPIIDQPISLEDLTDEVKKKSPSELFIETLGDKSQNFITSLTSQDIYALLDAENKIANAPPVLQSEGGGGILHYRNYYREDPYLRLWTGLVLQNIGNYSQAESEFSGAIKLGCNHWRISWYLAQAAEKSGNISLANKLLSDILKIPEARQVLEKTEIAPEIAVIEDLLYTGNSDEAERLLEEYISKNPPSPDLLNLKGEIKYQKGNHKEAKEIFKKVIQSWPEYGKTLNNLGVIYWSEGKAEEGLKQFMKALKNNPDDLTATLNTGDILINLGNSRQAEKLFSSFLERNPGNKEISSALNNIKSEAVKPESDTEASGEDIKNPDILREIKEIEILKKEGKFKIAEIAIKDLLRRYPESAELISPGSNVEIKEDYLVSAIVSAYNSEKFIAACLKDLESQTIADKIEIIVIDSGSLENEKAIVEEFQKKYKNIVYIRTEERESIYAAWNRGVRAARGKYITNSNTDDGHREDALELMVKVMEERPGYGMVYGDSLITNIENEIFSQTSAKKRFDLPDFNPGVMLSSSIFGQQPLWRRAVTFKNWVF